jgi:hypothetical protein
MSPVVALFLAAALAAPPAGSAPGEAERPVLAAPAGSAVSLEGRGGGSTCGYCGITVGGAIEERKRWMLLGGFVEAAAPVNPAAPTSTKPSRIVGSYFFGGHAGVVGELRGGDRVGVALEAGAQLASVRTVYATGSTLLGQKQTAVLPVLGARASVAWRLSSGSLVGLAAYVREPLTQPCLNVGLGCAPPSATYGLVVLGSLDLR